MQFGDRVGLLGGNSDDEACSTRLSLQASGAAHRPLPPSIDARKRPSVRQEVERKEKAAKAPQARSKKAGKKKKKEESSDDSSSDESESESEEVRL